MSSLASKDVGCDQLIDIVGQLVRKKFKNLERTAD